MLSHDRVFGLNYNGSDVTSDNDATPQNKIGTLAFVQAKEGMRVYRYMKAEEAFAVGQVAMISALLDNADVDAAATTSEKTLTATGDFTSREFQNGTFGSAYSTIDANTGAGQTRSIEQNTANVLTLDRTWSVALDTTSDYVTYDINYVSLADTDDVSATASAVMGVAISAVTDEYYAWFQVGGFCPLVRFVGSTDPAVRGAPIVPSGTAGAAKGYTTAGITAADAAVAFGIALHAYAAGDSAGVGIAAILNCRYALL